MINSMGRVADAFWRAAAYCLHPRVIAMSVLPLLLSAGLAFALGYFYWEDTVAGMRATLDSWRLIDTLLGWLDHVGASGFRSVMAPLLVLAFALPVIVVLSLLLVAMLMSSSLVALVGERRFPLLEKKQGGAWWKSLGYSLWYSILALLALLVSMPFWLIPPLVLFLPPLIWGWLGYKVFSFDALALHASVQERRQLMRQHRFPLLILGLVTGYLGAAPAAIWALGVMAVAMAPLLVLLSIWLYTLVFAFSMLWFTHYALAALQELRNARSGTTIPPVPPSVPALAEVLDPPAPPTISLPPAATAP
ncbi:EI24 domain-containing protein [Roseateles koreensis]|uniref:EI24 domain-containing protein n=1 Tax=Roseateles koreensis TaxID=2987526 RepID=A0ABT5KWD6_9BURK|nr:EI24 domain-containing protein [Roseateles koreensis]MDC8786730.1 EI24 domain-containing protein [Roseateles koreensis]